jgi:hypothetical protein
MSLITHRQKIKPKTPNKFLPTRLVPAYEYVVEQSRLDGEGLYRTQSKEMAAAFGVDESTARRWLQNLGRLGAVRVVSFGRDESQRQKVVTVRPVPCARLHAAYVLEKESDAAKEANQKWIAVCKGAHNTVSLGTSTHISEVDKDKNTRTLYLCAELHTARAALDAAHVDLALDEERRKSVTHPDNPYWVALIQRDQEQVRALEDTIAALTTQTGGAA